jgi:hypothetical protein
MPQNPCRTLAKRVPKKKHGSNFAALRHRAMPRAAHLRHIAKKMPPSEAEGGTDAGGLDPAL